MAFFVLSFFPLDVLDGIWDLIESVSEGFLTYSFKDISENEDFLDELQAIRSSYKPILEGITDDEEDFCFISWINLIALFCGY